MEGGIWRRNGTYISLITSKSPSVILPQRFNSHALGSVNDVYVAADSTEAMNIMENERVDLVLTDLRLGGEDGMSVIEKALAGGVTRSLRLDPHGKTLSAIVLTLELPED